MAVMNFVLLVTSRQDLVLPLLPWQRSPSSDRRTEACTLQRVLCSLPPVHLPLSHPLLKPIRILHRSLPLSTFSLTSAQIHLPVHRWQTNSQVINMHIFLI